ncbi:MAG: hypothetical protein LBV43_14145 [Prevotella sp.]|jgi:hypothetical protein|nr:hypothetical protein [Prevotella sp.]
MKKRLFFIHLLIFYLFILASCGYRPKTATLDILNNSQFQVTDMQGSFREKNIKILEPGENITLYVEWYETESCEVSINFSMNGEKYGTRKWTEAVTAPRKFRPYKQVFDGAGMIINIYDDYWEW